MTGIAAGAAVAAGAFAVPSAQAATFTVTNTSDADPGSLRDALTQANMQPGHDDIVFQSGVTGTITLATGELEISDDVAIQGPGASAITVSGNDASRVFYISLNTPYQPVSMSGLTIADGNVSASGAGIFNFNSALTLSSVVVTGNYAGAMSSLGSGGGVFSEFTTVVQDSVVSGNTATGGSGPKYAYGGGIHVDGGNLTLTDSEVSDNDAEMGGGVSVYDLGDNVSSAPNATIQRSTISGNDASFDGGGVYFEDSYNGGTLTIEASTLYANDANGRGGGLCVCEDPVGPTTVTNSTISGNDAQFGGGIANLNEAGQDLTVRSDTIVNNFAADSGGGIAAIGAEDSDVGVTSTIVANNTAEIGNGEISDDFVGPGDEVTAGFSLIKGAGTFTDGGQNITGQDPQLDALGAHGGPTDTHFPAPTSPAVDKGISGGLTDDQRTVVRTVDFPGAANAPGGDGTDIGSVEIQLLEAGPGPLVGQKNSGKLCLGERATIVGTKGKDKIVGTPGRDVIRGLRGNDRINGKGGNDLICGDKGNDRVKGGDGDDTARGGNGGDNLRGGAGNDLLRGGSGTDRIFGDADNDSMFGGAKQGKPAKGGGAAGPGNVCNGGEGTDQATGCETVDGVP